jgi:hypothetical protein
MIVVASCSQIGVYCAKTAKLALSFHRDGEVRDSTNAPLLTVFVVSFKSVQLLRI